jgi:hypothetical protein
VNQWKNGARRRAVATAGLLLFVGAVTGVLVDRLWLLPRTVEATPLTVRAMAARLDLAPPEEARVLTLLDSMHAELLTAAEHGPDSLRTAARNAHQRLEAALPPRARPEFRAWIQDHHHQLMERMGGARMHAPGHLDE